jgi:polysaccharide biosynthesis protein PslH
MKVLFISRHIPYKKNSGIAVNLSNKLACLSEVCEVTCAYIVDKMQFDNDYQDSYLNIENRYIISKYESNKFIRYTKHLIDIIYATKQVRMELSDIILQVRPDIIWLEFGYICHLILFLKKFNIPFVYCSHNSQFKLDYSIWKTNRNVSYKLKKAPAILLYLIHERLFFKLADIVLCISHHDIEYYKRFIPRPKLEYFPILFDNNNVSTIEASKDNSPYICMVGSLKSYQNYSAAIFALDKIWPLIQTRNSKLFLFIIGELPPADSDEYRELMHISSCFKNVAITGKVDSVIPYVKGAIVNIAPLLIGSGIRTKIIESVACKTPVVSTSIGAEGLPFIDDDSILIADNAEAFADKVLELITNCTKRDDIIRNAYSIYQQEFSYAAGINRIIKLLESVKVYKNQ